MQGKADTVAAGPIGIGTRPAPPTAACFAAMPPCNIMPVASFEICMHVQVRTRCLAFKQTAASAGRTAAPHSPPLALGAARPRLLLAAWVPPAAPPALLLPLPAAWQAALLSPQVVLLVSAAALLLPLARLPPAAAGVPQWYWLPAPHPVPTGEPRPSAAAGPAAAAGGAGPAPCHRQAAGAARVSPPAAAAGEKGARGVDGEGR